MTITERRTITRRARAVKRFAGLAALAAAVGCSGSISSGTPNAEGARTGDQGRNAANEETDEMGELKQAMFGAGCFWGVEVTFRKVGGVTDAAVGYAGGHVDNPTYKQVCTDETGHAEVVHVSYDPEVVSYERLLDVFFEAHDATQVNRQGPDIGSQYRSVVFFYDDAQRDAAEAVKERLNETGGRGGRPIVTQIEPAPEFFRAEEYHQRYLEKRGLASCSVPN